MPQRRFTDEQVQAILAENKAGKPASKLCKEHDISATTFYKWKEKFDPEFRANRAKKAKNRASKPEYTGLNQAEKAQCDLLKEENERLKLMLADAFIDGFRPNQETNIPHVKTQ